jgi:hypothetical protein
MTGDAAGIEAKFHRIERTKGLGFGRGIHSGDATEMRPESGSLRTG